MISHIKQPFFYDEKNTHLSKKVAPFLLYFFEKFIVYSCIYALIPLNTQNIIINKMSI